MFSLKNKLPLGLFALCAVSVVGMKDTGVFINEHVQRTYSGNEIEFSIGEKVEILENNGSTYYVSKGKAKVTIPQEKILLTEVDAITYRVVKASPIFDENGQIIRSLFVDETVVEISSDDKNVKIKCNDGIVGNVDKNALVKVSESKNNGTDIKVKNNAVASNSKGQKLNLTKGQTVNAVDFLPNGYFIIEENGIRYNINSKNIDIVTGQKIDRAPEDYQDEIEKEIIKAKEAKNNNDNKEEREYREAPAVNGSKAAHVISSAQSKLGSTYVYGDTGKAGYDCSGLIYSIYKNELGISLPRSSREQSGYGTQVSKSDLQAGDLVFFNTTGSGVSHVGIYIGDGQFIHASSGQKKVITSSLDEGYYEDRYVNATRVL